MTRRKLLAGLLAPADRLFPIAHRGGVVDERTPENSRASVEAAVARGYWMIEVDVRESKDGRPVMQHDATFERYYGVKRAAPEMIWAEIGELRATPGGESPLDFDELAALCAGRMRVMLDIKGEHAAAFY